MRVPRAARRAVVVILLVGVSAGCGGESRGSVAERAPVDASVADFCAAYFAVQDVESGQDVRDWVDRFAEVGTPPGVAAEARAGFEVLVEVAAASDAEADVADLADPDVSAAEQADLEAFSAYVATTCAEHLAP
ncbi:hypothetical protein [Nocardioides sp.]|uniref:hypothetical protein n=1 Tax=Nocardioides sp. TaxID=35761 RepID=UPI0027352CC3|nr:hypothetical protein [Nocardioides sp.]MDP3891377.1 hypothetical protein [Nocardioides sp.]